ncbi:hypothetical protein E2C01_062109 [Portunus trituberculatus]|uniref:Uncharacterized protein n=1 Tax=Portunus trituberculatus TaxID=210409 RepID=A0A5B7HH45_PORTR|nr:hypothetical protein [Portunus trituberculatus]
MAAAGAVTLRPAGQLRPPGGAGAARRRTRSSGGGGGRGSEASTSGPTATRTGLRRPHLPHAHSPPGTPRRPAGGPPHSLLFPGNLPYDANTTLVLSASITGFPCQYPKREPRAPGRVSCSRSGIYDSLDVQLQERIVAQSSPVER